MRILFSLFLSSLLLVGEAQISDKSALALYDQILSTRNPNAVLDMLHGIDLAEVSSDSLRSYLFYYRATSYGQLSKFDSADYYMLAARRAVEEGKYPELDIQLFRAYGNINWAKNFFNLALLDYQKALTISQEINHAEFETSLLANIGGVYARLENYQLALDYVKQSHLVGEKAGVIRPRSHMKIGIYSLAIGETAQAIASLKETISFIEAEGKDSIALGVAHNALAEAYLENENLMEARYHTLTADTILNKVNYSLPDLYINKARLMSFANDAKSADFFILKAIQVAEEKQDLSGMLGAQKYYKALQVSKNNWESVANIQETIQTLSDSLKAKQMLDRVYELEAQFDTQKKEAEITRLSLENDLKDSRILAVGVVAVLIIIMMIVFFILYSKKQRIEKEAQELQMEAMKKRFMELHSSPAELAVDLDFEDLNSKLNTPLTEREFDALRLSIEGKTNAEIADKLFISVSTVKFHLRNTYAKMGVGNRKEAFQYMLKTS